MIRREVIENIGGFDERLRLLEDYEFALRLSLQGPWAFIREPLVVWHETMVSLYHDARSEEIAAKEVQVLEEYLAQTEGARRHRSARSHALAALKRTRRHLWASKMKISYSGLRSALAEAVLEFEKYRSAAFRRSPWFPKMRAVAIEFWSREILQPTAPLPQVQPLDSQRL